MTAANVQWIGANNSVATNDAQKRALFLKVFAGEVITAFEKHTLVLDKHQIRTIKSGKSASFPVFGRMPDAQYHTSGTEILGQNVPMSEREIFIDGLLLSHIFLPNIDEAMAHYDVRGPYSQMMGQKLSQAFDKNVMHKLISAARDTAGSITADTTDKGYVIEVANLASATAADKFTAWMDAIKAIKVNFDNKFVTGKQYLIVRPDDFWFLATYVTTTGFSLANRDYVPDANLGSIPRTEYLGIQIIPSPMMPRGDFLTDAYHPIDCDTTVGIAFTDQAVGTVKLMDLATESEYDIRRQGHLMVAKYAMGHGVLRAACAVELRTANFAALYASLSTALVGDNNDLVFTAKTSGVVGNSITITLVDPGAVGDESCAVVGTDITVTLGNSAVPAIDTTAAVLKALIEATPAAHALVSVTHKAGNNGTGIVTALAKTALAGGAHS